MQTAKPCMQDLFSVPKICINAVELFLQHAYTYQVRISATPYDKDFIELSVLGDATDILNVIECSN